MKTTPSKRAWENDPLWKEVVNVLTRGRKLRPEHYLDKLSAEDLEQLHLALSFSGTFEEQQKLCPPRRGGETDGALPAIRVLSEISQAIRQVTMLRGLERLQLIQAATKERGQQIGLDPRITDAVCNIVAEETLAQEAKGVVGNFAINAAHVLMQRETGLAKKNLEDRKLSIADRRVKLLEDKAKQYDKAKGVMQDKELSEDERKLKMRQLFGIS